MDQQAQALEEHRDAWGDYNRRQEFEHLLIDRKTTWLLTSQGLLFAAYAISLQGAGEFHGGHFRDTLAGSGMAIATVSLVGVLAVIASKVISWKAYQAYFAANPPLPPPLVHRKLQWGVATWNTPLSLLPDVSIPLVLLLAWCALR